MKNWVVGSVPGVAGVRRVGRRFTARIRKRCKSSPRIRARTGSSFLIEGAKKEGPLLFYATFPIEYADLLIEPFRSRYGIKVDLWRARSENRPAQGHHPRREPAVPAPM